MSLPITNITLDVDEVAIALVALEEVNITDASSMQRGLKRKLCRILKRKAPDYFKDLIELGKFTDNSKEKRND